MDLELSREDGRKLDVGVSSCGWSLSYSADKITQGQASLGQRDSFQGWLTKDAEREPWERPENRVPRKPRESKGTTGECQVSGLRGNEREG